MASKIASCCGATRVVSELTTVWNAGTVLSWRTTLVHATVTVAFGEAAAAAALARRSSAHRGAAISPAIASSR